ncbi:UTRA domain-containing protein [Streptomyces sp. NPDC052682]|uniref:UTRA domain-containing protein n=1 Tax=Streptomyces sp. NPDC052682 TaxID=3154954 RepID=UPI003439D41C
MASPLSGRCSRSPGHLASTGRSPVHLAFSGIAASPPRACAQLKEGSTQRCSPGTARRLIATFPPGGDEVQLLQLAPGEWVVELHRTTFTADGTVVEFALGVHAATHFSWTYDFKVPDSAVEGGGKK